MREIRQGLGKKLEAYIKIILEEYGKYLPAERKEFLTSIDNYEDCIVIANTGTISMFYKQNKIYFPTLAFQLLEAFSKHPLYGTDPTHKCYDENTLIENNNTFEDYIEHAIIKGLTPEEYFQESLLHETVHFCGSGGGDPIREGLTELKTRELAQKRGLVTSACGYPKEVSVVLRLQNIFGEEIMNKIAFSGGPVLEVLEKDFSDEAVELYRNINRKMRESSFEYLSTNFEGEDAHNKKAQLYGKIDYSEVHKILDNYELKQMINIESSPLIKKEEVSHAVKN